MPALGMAQTTGIVVQWKKQAGDQVAKGEPLLDVETDKAVVEVEAPASGTLASISAEAGAEVPVGNSDRSDPRSRRKRPGPCPALPASCEQRAWTVGPSIIRPRRVHSASRPRTSR